MRISKFSVLGACAIALAGIYTAHADPIKIRLAYVVPVSNWAPLFAEKKSQALGHVLRLRSRALSGYTTDDHGNGGERIGNR
ncbi:MAG TPA: hypothetical protein VE396_01165 [Xanthobacteraceae bacterium]|nr:hypothetical protein [Xanthobacteraceae bacterium]